MRRLSRQPWALSSGPIKLAASDTFRRYKPEESHEVRQPMARTKTPIEELRARREMLISMDPKKVKEIIEFHTKLNFFQALVLAKREGKLMVPNSVHERILTETGCIAYNYEYARYLEQNYPAWTGTIVIYEDKFHPFKDQFIFNDVFFTISFAVPQRFRGKTNCMLVVEHPDFDIVDLGYNKFQLKVDDEKIYLIEDVCRGRGCRMPGELPQTKGLAAAKYSSYLGPVVRCEDGLHYEAIHRTIGRDDWHRERFKVALF